MNKYFNVPTQVFFRYFLDDENIRFPGIAYEHKIICLHCGQVFNIEDEIEEIEDIPIWYEMKGEEFQK